MVTVLILILLMVLCLLPFVPGLLEASRRTDTRPLRIVHASEVNIRHLARGFRQTLEREILPLLSRITPQGTLERGELNDGSRWLAAGRPLTAAELADEGNGAGCVTVLASGVDLELADGGTYLAEIYGAGHVHGGPRTVCRAVLAEGDLHLGRESITLRWLHAGGRLHAGTGTVLFGRASSDQDLTLEEGCRFERLQAPTIAFGISGEPGPEPSTGNLPGEDRLLNPDDLDKPVQRDGRRWLIRGHLEIPAERLLEADIVCTGKLTIGRGTVLRGAVKARKQLVLEDNVILDGGAVCEHDLIVGRHCRIKGPVVAEGLVQLGYGTVVGLLEAPTTVSAATIRCEPGVDCHGTVWAHQVGDVLLPDPEEPTLAPGAADTENEKGAA